MNLKIHGRMEDPGLPKFGGNEHSVLKCKFRVLHYENVEKSIFPPQKDYMREISQLLVHTLEGMRSKERRVERE